MKPQTEGGVLLVLVTMAVFLTIMLVLVKNADQIDGTEPAREPSQLDTLYMLVSEIQDDVNNVTLQMNKLCVDMARSHGADLPDAEAYCEVR